MPDSPPPRLAFTLHISILNLIWPSGASYRRASPTARMNAVPNPVEDWKPIAQPLTVPDRLGCGQSGMSLATVASGSSFLVKQFRHRHPVDPEGTGSTCGTSEHQQSWPGLQEMGALHSEQSVFIVESQFSLRWDLAMTLRDLFFVIRCGVSGQDQPMPPYVPVYFGARKQIRDAAKEWHGNRSRALQPRRYAVQPG